MEVGVHWVALASGGPWRSDAALGALLVGLADGEGLAPIGTPRTFTHPDGTRLTVLLLSASHASIRVAPSGDVELDLFSCTGLDPERCARTAGAHLSPSSLTWAVSGRVARWPAGWGAERGLFATDEGFDLASLVGALVPEGDDLVHRFEPHGVSWIRSGPDRWVAVHTWPEHRLLTLDLRGGDGIVGVNLRRLDAP